MRSVLVVLCGALLCALAVTALLVPGAPALGQEAASAPYDLQQGETTSETVSRNGTHVKVLTVHYTVTPRKDHPQAGGQGYEIVIYERIGAGEDREVKRIPIPQAKVIEGLSTVLALDISGSMNDPLPGDKVPRIQQARTATSVFFEKLPPAADTGLILFNHTMALEEPLTLDRQKLRNDIAAAQPRGGTAYLDATVRGVQMLQGVRHKKVVVVMTDGVDLNSTATLATAIQAAKAAGVQVYTIGIGEPGKQIPMTSVLVLDRSGSMQETADDRDRVSKIVALKKAGNLFMSFVRPGLARTTVLDFSDTPGVPRPFSSERDALRATVNGLKPGGETALFDATYDAIAALEAEQPRGKAAIVALTDGIDNSSRRRVEEVIARAKQARILPARPGDKERVGIPLYMLGFGRPGELDEKVMQRMAQETGGQYFHAKNQDALLDIFEKLSNRLHDDGINEADLQKLAFDTGGQYYHAKDADKLQFIVEKVVGQIQQTDYTQTFDDLDQADDGLNRGVRLALVRGGGEVVARTHEGTVGTHGLVIPEVNTFVYLFLLVLIGVLIALPAGVRRISRPTS